MKYPSCKEYINSFYSKKLLLSPLKEQVPDEMVVIRSGKSSVIFHCYDEKKYIVLHCWTNEIENLFDRYQKICGFINNSALNYLIKPNLFKDSILIDNKEYPCIASDCSGGEILKEFIKKNLHNKNVILQTAEAFRYMVANLHKNLIAHGNLTDHHIIVFPKKKIQLKLINYDSMFIPELANEKDIEKGHPCFQHSDRINQTRLLNCKLDYFSELIIYLSLRCVAIDSNIWYKLGINDRKYGLLFCNNSEEFIVSDTMINNIDTIAQKDIEIEYLLNKLIDFTKLDRIDDLIPLEEILDEYHLQQHKVNQGNIFFNSMLALTNVYNSMKEYLKNQKFRKLFLFDMLLLGLAFIVSLFICFLFSLFISNQNYIHDYWGAIFVLFLLFIYKPLQINALQIIYFSTFNILSCYLANNFGHLSLSINNNTYSSFITYFIFMLILFFFSIYLRQIIIIGFNPKKNSHYHVMDIPLIYLIAKSFILIVGAFLGYIIVHGLSELMNLFISFKLMRLGIGTAIFYFVLYFSIFFFINKSFDKIYFKITSIFYMSIFCGLADFFIESLLLIIDSYYINKGFSLSLLYSSMAFGVLLGMNEELRPAKKQMWVLICFIFFGAFIGDLVRDYFKEWLKLDVIEHGGSAAVFFGVLSFAFLYGLKVISCAINQIQILYFSFFVCVSAYWGEWLRLFLMDQMGKGIFVQGIGTGFFYGTIGFGVLFGFRTLEVLADPIYLKSTKKLNLKK